MQGDWTRRFRSLLVFLNHHEIVIILSRVVFVVDVPCTRVSIAYSSNISALSEKKIKKNQHIIGANQKFFK